MILKCIILVILIYIAQRGKKEEAMSRISIVGVNYEQGANSIDTAQKLKFLNDKACYMTTWLHPYT